MSCPHCDCTCADGAQAHALLALLATDDIDAALEAGLLETATCPDCTPCCRSRLVEVRDARRTALAARERYRARDTRLQRRKVERDAARVPKASTAAPPALPAAAADVLARALAKAGLPR